MTIAGAVVFALLVLCAGMVLPFCVLGAVHLAWWRADRVEAAANPDAEPAPITFLRPLKRGVPELREKLVALVNSTLAGDQIVLGADADSEELALCSEVRAQFSGRDIAVVACAPGAALNPKIAKLTQMMPAARHDRLLVSDSEVIFDPGFVRAFRDEWEHSGADAQTAAYRFVNLKTWPQRLDAAPVLMTLWPGLAIVRKRGVVRLTLGACAALRRDDLAAVGGWERFANELAEDNRLGAALAAAGRTIRLSAEVVTLDSDPISWRDYWRHQRRMALTYRACDPLGFAGSAFMQVWPWYGLMLLVAGGDEQARMSAWQALVILLGARIVATVDGSRLTGFRLPWLAPVVLVATFVESLCWVLSWRSQTVWWGGQEWRVSFRGRLLASRTRSPAAPG